ncbi:MAG: rod shape-determining protein MreC [Oscillospiraceae bacterium]|nr:rod shape-determining protein MreC [Oscillospiraceae bacterium]
MKEFFHSVKFRILICIAALLLGLMTYVAVTIGTQTAPEQIISTITYPFVSAANAISNGVSGFIDKLVNADKYKSENERLSAELAEMYKHTMDFDSLKQENDQLREMLELKERSEDFIFSEPCAVIGRNSNDIYCGFTINKGKTSGISEGDPVITSVGLVGRVTSIADNYAKVTTVLSPQVNVGVYTMRSKTTGVLENDINSAQQGLCLMSNILKDADIREGDIIFTSGKSGLFPDDVQVGIVKEIYDDPNGFSKHAVIELTQDVRTVTSVFVITDFSGKGIPFELDE